MTPDDYELMAYVDGELDAQTSKRVAEAVEADPVLRAKVEALIASRDVARAAYAPAETAPLSPALAKMMQDLRVDIEAPERDETWQASDIEGMGGAGALAWPRHRLIAMVGMGVAAGAMAAWMLVSQFQPKPFLVLTEANGLALSDPAQRILTDMPAGRETEGFSVQTSFLSDQGAACRQFAISDQAGIACLDQQTWHLVVLTDAPSEETFQAAGGTDLLATAAAQIGVSKVLSEDEEAARIANDWQPPID